MQGVYSRHRDKLNKALRKERYGLLGIYGKAVLGNKMWCIVARYQDSRLLVPFRGGWMLVRRASPLGELAKPHQLGNYT